jgi:formate hydrogenlyase subunit 3/multisubunit Na+/H+ antiporter MnhD subunit
MSLWTGPLLPLVALAWPVLLAGLAALPALRGRAVRLLPLAPLPALLLALLGTEGTTSAPDLLLGVELGLDAARRLLLGLTAVLWFFAGLAAQPMTGRPNTALFSGFWCLTLAGNLGVFLALDAVTFYVAFAAVSLAAWFLVVHDRTEAALQAGRVYIVIALVGEVLLLIGLLLGAGAAASAEIADIREALGTSATGPVAMALLTVGFGIKAGMVPLHVWLPLAHPAAPVPASAVLSGAIVKAGLFGMILFLPERDAGDVLVILGLAGAFGAALWGLTQSNPKAVLAYSTVSQMGLMVMLVGAGGAAREMAPYYALHHGLAKGALFLLVGAMLAAVGRGPRLACLAAAIAVSASVAGVPLTGGALAKAAAKPGLSDALALAMSLGSVATTVILAWFLHRLWLLPDARLDVPRWGLRLAVPCAVGVLAFIGPWLFWQTWTGRRPGYLLAVDPALDALWPVAAGLLAAALLLRRGLPQQPPGDLLRVVERWRPGPIGTRGASREESGPTWRPDALIRAIFAVEARLTRWPFAGTVLSALALILFAIAGAR